MWQWTPGGLLTLLASGVFAVLSAVVWRRREGTTTRWLALVLLATGIWSLAYTLELASPTASARHIWGDLKYVGICALPPAWVAFVSVYTGGTARLRRRTMLLLAVEPLVVLSLLSNMRTHALIRYYSGGPTSQVPLSGPLFWPHSIYTYLLMWGATAVLVVRLTRVSPLYRRLSEALVLSFALPFVVNVLFNAGIEPFDAVDLTPFAFLFSGLVLVWGVLRYRLVRLQPAGRSQVFMTIRDLVVTLDPMNRVIDANPAATAAFGLPVSRLIGRELEVLLPGSGSLLTGSGQLLPGSGQLLPGSGQLLPGSGQRIVGPPDPAPQRETIGGRLYDVQRTGLTDRDGHPLGTLVMAHDVTDRVRAEEALATSTAEFVAAFEFAPLGMAVVGLDGRILSANQALSEISGFSVDELMGMNLDELTDPRDAPTEYDQLAEVAAGRIDEYRCELRLVRADRGRRWVAFSVARIGEPGSGTQAVLHVEDITDRKGYETGLVYLADHDPLTGLANRRRFHEDLEHYLTLATRANVSGALILLDLDNFKHINDTFGHPTGDALLCSVAEAFRSRVRVSDVIARLGGDEFAILLWAVDADGATTAAHEVLDAVRNLRFDRAGKQVRMTASAGLIVLDGTGDRTADDVIGSADLAMYAAKDRGRDGLVVFESTGTAVAHSRARTHWTDEIHRALDDDQFTLLTQPTLDLTTGQITGCELLLRMRQGDHLVVPEEFLGVAERHGLASAIDTRVVRLGTDLAARYRQPPGFRWEINIAASSLGDTDLPLVIQSELAAKHLAPESFVFEISEAAAIANATRALTFARRVTDLGCGFALDDFGAGYGSFYYLKHLPCDYLKIDGEFIRDLRTNRTNQIIVQALVSAAHGLHKQTIAEYVTDKRTLELVRDYGVDHAQGYYIGRPSEPSTGLPMGFALPDGGI